MGMFMASVAFRRGKHEEWENVKPEIEKLFLGVGGLVNNLDQDCTGYVIVSPYGDKGRFLAELPDRISRLVGDYAVMATCVDSDFIMLELYYNGKLIEESCLGKVYEEYSEFCEINKPKLENWKALLLDSSKELELSDVFEGEEVFAEDYLRKLSGLTGLPIFDDALIFGGSPVFPFPYL